MEKPLGLQHPERFPDGVPRHAKSFGEPVLDKPFSLLEGAVEDLPTEFRGYHVTQRKMHAAERSPGAR
jgi:hypothetical protein